MKTIKNMKWAGAIALIAGLTGSAQAQSVGSRGGGDVVVCYDSNRKIIDMVPYDFWNASKGYRLTVQFDRTTPYMIQLKRNFERFAKVDPAFSKYLLEQAQNFSPETILSHVGFMPGIADNGDSGRSVVPQYRDPSCASQEILRMAEFSVDPLPYEKEYKLTEYLWNAANEGTKYGIIQHELIYSFSKKYLAENTSAKAQLFNALISSQEMDAYDGLQYAAFLNQLKWKDKHFSILHKGYTYLQTSFVIGKEDSTLEFYGGDLMNAQMIRVQGQDFLVDHMFRRLQDDLILNFNSIRSVRLSTPAGNVLQFDMILLLDEAQRVLYGQLDSKVENEFFVLGQISKVKSFISFYPNGKLKEVTTYLSGPILRAVGVKYRGWYEIHLKEDGSISSVSRHS